MKKSLVTHILVMIIAIVVGYFLAASLSGKRTKIIQVEDEMSKAPIGGLNKFASDVQWMLFINYCGGLEAVKKENVEEIYSRLKSILGNDPNHELAYELGGMMFSVRDPKKAVEIFTAGTENPNLKDNWRLPFYAGFVLTQHMTDEDDPQRLEKAILMFRKAIARNNTMPHIFSALIRTRAKILQKRGKWGTTPIVNDKHAYLCALFDEWRKGGESDGEGMGMGNEVFSGNSATVDDFRPRLLLAAQKAKASAPNNPDVLKTIDKVLKKVLRDDHLCSKCLTPYAAGDKFCSKCGNAVEVFGICPNCKTVMKGDFCASCGYSKNSPKKVEPKKEAAPAKEAKAVKK